MLRIGPLTRAYQIARSSGFLDTSIGRGLFIASYFAYKKYLEDPYHALIRKRPELFRDGHILDIGANIGYCSILFASATGPGQKVYAFEPEPFNFQLLQDVIRRRHAGERVVPVRTAAGASDGTLNLWINCRHHGDHRIVTDVFRDAHASGRNESIAVPAIAIDGFLERERAGPVRFIKVDVQGYELAVCQGMVKTLAANPDCVVSLEYMPAAMRDLGFDPPELLSWLAGRGYLTYTLMRNGDLKEGAPQRLQPGEWSDLIFSRRPFSFVQR